MNGLTPPKAGVTDWPPGPSTRAARGAPQPSEPFAGIFDATQARTATAEGQEKSSRTRSRDRREDGPNASERAEARSNADWARERRAADGVERERPVQHHGDAAPAPADGEAIQEAAVPAEQAQQPTSTAGEQVVAPAAAAVVIVPTAVIVEAPAAESVPAQAQAAAAASAAAPAAQPQTAGEQAVAPVATAAAAQAPTEAKTPQADVQAAVAAADEVELPVEAGVQPTAKQPAPAERNAAPAAQNGASASQGQQQSANPNGSGKNDQPGTLPQQAADQARAVAQAYGRPAERRPAAAEAPAPQPQAAPQAAPVATPVAPAATANAAAARAVANATPVPLSRAAENVEHVLRLGSSRGVTHARIALNPAELGSIDVHLRQTAEGLVARVVAHAPEAVLQLQQAGDDLRRSLEQQGVNLLSLDIGQSGDERAAGRAGTFGDDDSGARNGRGESADGASEGDAEVTTKTTLQLPNGVLVDVLA